MANSSPRENASEAGEQVNEPSPPATNFGATLINSLRELLECPVCMGDIYPPIYQCSNGHILCTACKPKLKNRCPMCRSELGDIRCLALEKVSTSLLLPCKYESFGCESVHPCHNKFEHESQCSFRPYECPYADCMCTVVGNIPHLVAHLKDDHKAPVFNSKRFSIWYANTDGLEHITWCLRVFSCFGQFFCLHFEALKLKEVPVYIAFVQFMGEKNEANNYRYRLEVGGNERKQIWEGVPRSIRESRTKVRDSYDGIMIQEHIGLYFSGGDMKKLKLKVKGKIWKRW